MSIEIRVRTLAEFERLLSQLKEEEQYASDSWALYKGLDDSMGEDVSEFNSAPEFWRITLSGLRQGIFAALGRLYDKGSTALSLRRFLVTVKSHPDLAIKTGDSLNLPELEAELQTVTKDDLLVKRLHHIRDKSVAHRDAELIRLANFSSLTGFQPHEVEILLKRAATIVNKYRFLSGLPPWSANRNDDYQRLLEYVRLGMVAAASADAVPV